MFQFGLDPTQRSIDEINVHADLVSTAVKNLASQTTIWNGEDSQVSDTIFVIASNIVCLMFVFWGVAFFLSFLFVGKQFWTIRFMIRLLMARTRIVQETNALITNAITVNSV
jgi:predicted RNase H-related nuclease YkuK (DUF458 family)